MLRVKDLGGRGVGERVTVWDSKILKRLQRCLQVERFEGWEGQKEKKLKRAREMGWRGWSLAYTGEDSMGVTTG